MLEPYLEPVDLPIRHFLERRNRPIEKVCFIERGFVSVVANRAERSIEVGLIGSEGMTGVAVILGTDRSVNDTYVQSAGAGQSMPAKNLRQAIRQSASLHRVMLLYAFSYMTQTAQTAAANGRSNIEQRLARWLLMAHDRIDGNELQLTHEFLAMMLGVRRPGVTVALNLLEKQALIRTGRGVIVLLDRKGLETCSDGTYGVPEAEFRRVFR